MMGPLNEILSADHDRIDGLLDSAVKQSGEIDSDRYAEFRKGLLKHIGMEEKIFLPTLARFREGRQTTIAERIRLEHSAQVPCSFLRRQCL